MVQGLGFRSSEWRVADFRSSEWQALYKDFDYGSGFRSSEWQTLVLAGVGSSIGALFVGLGFVCKSSGG